MDLEASSGVDSVPRFVNGGDGGGSGEALGLKIGRKGEEEGGAQGEGEETDLRGDLDVVGGGEGVIEDKAGDVEGVDSGVVEKEVESSVMVDKKLSEVVDDDPLEEEDVDIGDSVVRERSGDGVGEKEAVTSVVIDKKCSKAPDDDDDDDQLEDVDVDIDGSGDLRTGMLIQSGHAVVDSVDNEVGNKRENMEVTTTADKLEKENEMAVESVDADTCEDVSGNVDKMGQDDAIGEPVSGKYGVDLHPGGGTVGNVAGESEDEEVDIGGDHEPNIFTNPGLSTDENVRPEPMENVLHASYQLAAGKEGRFSVSDMVWGKVRSHPWWPGQIFDPSKASEVATKHHKKEKDCYLVAFFGDRTFAWSESSQLKHFRAHFPHVEKQSGSEALHHAISCALEEVSRRVELGLACKCIHSDVYESLRYQNVENTGIQEEESKIESTDESASMYLFEPRNFLQFVKSVAQDPSNGADQLEIVIAKAQLLAFNRRKGYYHLPEYQFNELSLNSNSETVTDSTFTEGHNQNDISLKRKHNSRDIVYTSKRERSMDDNMLLMGEDYEDDDDFHSGKRQNIGGAPKQSFKIGDCIVRAASQLTGSPGPSSFLKSINEKYQKVSENNGASRDVHAQHENHNINSSISVADDVLLQPQSVAHDPMKEPSANNLGNTSPSPDIAVDGRNAKAPKSVKGSPEAYEFEDMKDSYWTDRVIQNGGEEKPERKLNFQVVTLQPPATFSRTPRVHSRKRYSNGSHKVAAERPMSTLDKSKQDMLPAELILNFPDINSIPSESKLNNMFRRFGPLKEFETEVDRDSNRARVVFKRASDAEVAYSSCEKFNIFGSSVVRYELSYTPSVSYKAAKLQATQGMETDSLPEIDFASSAHDLEFITMQELEDATMQDLQYPHHHDLEGVTMQDLEFTTTHDLEFPGSQDLDIVTTHPSEVASMHLDISAQDQNTGTLEMPSSVHLEFQAGENMTDGFTAAPLDMEIGRAEVHQPNNQVPSIKTHGDLECEKLHQIEAVTVQQVEQVMNPETADTRGSVPVESSAQATDNLLAQDTEVAATEGVVVTTSGEEILAKQDPVSDNQVDQGKASEDNVSIVDATTLQEPEDGTDHPMILSDQIAEQEDNLENDTCLSNQTADPDTNLENASMDIEESQVASVEDDTLEIEMQAPDVEKVEQDPVEIGTTGDSVPATVEDAATETVVTSAGANEAEDTKGAPSEIKHAGTTQIPAAAVISKTGDVVSVVAADTEVETSEHDELQVAPDAEVTHDDSAEIVETQLLKPQSVVDTTTDNVVGEGVTNVQDNEDGLTIADEEDLRNQDSNKVEQKVADSTTNKEAT